jgi:hypothetical protein
MLQLCCMWSACCLVLTVCVCGGGGGLGGGHGTGVESYQVCDCVHGTHDGCFVAGIVCGLRRPPTGWWSETVGRVMTAGSIACMVGQLDML